MVNDIIHILNDKVNRIESSQVKKSAKISPITNNYKKRNDNNKKNFKKALVDAGKNIEDEKLQEDSSGSVIMSSSLAHLIEENSKIGSILQEKMASNPRLSEILKEKSKTSSEPLDRSKNSEN